MLLPTDVALESLLCILISQISQIFIGNLSRVAMCHFYIARKVVRLAGTETHGGHHSLAGGLDAADDLEPPPGMAGGRACKAGWTPALSRPTMVAVDAEAPTPPFPSLPTSRKAANGASRERCAMQ